MAETLGSVEVEQLEGHLVARIVGEVDVSNVDEIAKALEDATESRKPAHVVDLSRTTYFDSSGIRLLFELATRLQARRQQLHVVVPRDGVTRRVLELTDLASIVPLHDALEDVAG